jgi:rhodanese-related sulfurtransferase
MNRTLFYWAVIAALIVALPVSAQTFRRKPAKGDQNQEQKSERIVTALPVVEGDPDEIPKDRITVQQLKQKIDDKADIIILDVRSRASYQSSLVKIKGAIHIPFEQIEQRMNELPKDKEIISYCSCPEEATSASVVRTLRANGFKDVKALLGGLDKWEAAGYPVEPKEKK